MPVINRAIDRGQVIKHGIAVHDNDKNTKHTAATNGMHTYLIKYIGN